MATAGATTIKDMGSDPGVDWILDERQMTRDGHLPGPTIRAAGPVMNGSGKGKKVSLQPASAIVSA